MKTKFPARRQITRQHVFEGIIRSLCFLIAWGWLASFGLKAQTFSNGVDPSHLGKGDWIWQMPVVEARLNVTNTQAVIDYEVNLGMQWIAVKCGDGTNALPTSWTQYSTNLIAQAHAAGLKIFGWARVYGGDTNTVAGEINTAIQALRQGGDGFIFDAENAYQTGTNNEALATRYCAGIRAIYPQAFLAYMPYPRISNYPAYPYKVFGKYADAVMPQDFWVLFNISPQMMVSLMDNEWTAWANTLVGDDRNAIKPIIPVAETDTAGETAGQIEAFVNSLMTDESPAVAGGYHGVSFWDCQERTEEMDAGIKSVTIRSPVTINPPQFQPISLAGDGAVRLSLNDQAGVNYAIETSSNLVDWLPLTTITNASGSDQFTDTAAASRPATYYRARVMR